MAEAVSVDEHQLDELPELNPAVSGDEVWHEALPAHGIVDGTEPSAVNHIPANTSDNGAALPGEVSDDDSVSAARTKISGTTSTAIGTWIGATVAIGALAIAVYYGYWSLSLQRWSALKDFKSECQDAKELNISTPECIAALALPPIPPPVTKRFAQKLYACLTFQPGCSDAPDQEPALNSPRSLPPTKKPWWLLLLQTLLLLTLVSGLVWLQSIPPERLRATISQRLGPRRMRILQTVLRIISRTTWEICVFVSCFSPLYAVWFWWMHRKRLRFSSIVALTYIGGAFTVYYVYGSRVAAIMQRESKRRSWRVDEGSLEEQVWTRPDGVNVTTLRGETPGGDKAIGADVVDSEWNRGGRMRRHR